MMRKLFRSGREKSPNQADENKENATPLKSADDKPKSVLENYGYNVKETIGHGSYATVKRAYSNYHKMDVAIKIITKKKAPEDYIQKFLPREIQVVKILHNRNLVCFFQSIETTLKVYLVMDLADKGDLLDVIRKYKNISEKQSVIWFYQMVDGLDYIHKKRVCHRDLKCENVLLDARNRAKITDFGFARVVPDLEATGGEHEAGMKFLSSTYCGSYAYAPPEILTGTPYDPFVSDVWSLGVILYTMLYGKLPFDDSDHKRLLRAVHNRLQYPNLPFISTDCKNLLDNILTNPKDRYTIESIRRDAWFLKASQPPSREPSGKENETASTPSSLADKKQDAGKSLKVPKSRQGATRSCTSSGTGNSNTHKKKLGLSSNSSTRNKKTDGDSSYSSAVSRTLSTVKQEWARSRTHSPYNGSDTKQGISSVTSLGSPEKVPKDIRTPSSSTSKRRVKPGKRKSSQYSATSLTNGKTSRKSESTKHVAM